MKRTELAGFLQELSEKILNDPPKESPMIDGRDIPQLQRAKILEAFEKISKKIDDFELDHFFNAVYTSISDNYTRMKDLNLTLERINSTSRIIYDGSHEFFKYQREFNSALHASILSLIKRVKDLEEILWYNVKPNTIPGKKEQNTLFEEDELKEFEQDLPLTDVDRKLKEHADEYLKYQKIREAAHEVSEAIDQEKKQKKENPSHPAAHDLVNVNPSDHAVHHPKKIHVEVDCVICKRITTHIEVGDNLHCKECGNIGMSVDQFLKKLEKQKKEELEIQEEEGKK